MKCLFKSITIVDTLGPQAEQDTEREKKLKLLNDSIEEFCTLNPGAKVEWKESASQSSVRNKGYSAGTIAFATTITVFAQSA